MLDVETEQACYIKRVQGIQSFKRVGIASEQCNLAMQYQSFRCSAAIRYSVMRWLCYGVVFASESYAHKSNVTESTALAIFLHQLDSCLLTYASAGVEGSCTDVATGILDKSATSEPAARSLNHFSLSN